MPVPKKTKAAMQRAAGSPNPGSYYGAGSPRQKLAMNLAQSGASDSAQAALMREAMGPAPAAKKKHRRSLKRAIISKLQEIGNKALGRKPKPSTYP